jgi:hypothetical protein
MEVEKRDRRTLAGLIPAKAELQLPPEMRMQSGYDRHEFLH